MKTKIFPFLLLVTIIAAVFFGISSCSAGLVIGRSNKQYQETKTSVNADSSRFVPSITIN